MLHKPQNRPPITTTNGTPQHLKILLAHDLPTRASAFEEALNANPNFIVRTTSDAREIEPLFNKWHFDILFLDMHMAHLPGSIVLAHFSRAIKAKELAVIAMCNVDDFAMLERALVLGALDACAINIPPAEAMGRAYAAGRWLKKSDRLETLNNEDGENITPIPLMPFSMLG
ncbi:MAG: response regulator [Rhodospirillaceae bacterium]|nr:response regulator [Rhodospirillaceae bacterium]